jgi:hypothetical protein
LNILIDNLNPGEPVGAKRKSRFIGELKIEDLWWSLRSVFFKMEKIP